MAHGADRSLPGVVVLLAEPSLREVQICAGPAFIQDAGKHQGKGKQGNGVKISRSLAQRHKHHVQVLADRKEPFGKGRGSCSSAPAAAHGCQGAGTKGHSSERSIQPGAAAKLLCLVSSAHKDRQHQQTGGTAAASLTQHPGMVAKGSAAQGKAPAPVVV